MIQQAIHQPIQQPIYDRASQCSGNGVEHSWLGHGVAVAKAFAKSLIPMEDPHFSINPDKALEGIGRLATAIILPTSPILFIAKDIADAWFGNCEPGPDAKPELPQTSKATGEEAQEKEPGSKDAPLQQPSAARYQGSQGTRGLLALGTLASSFHCANSNAIADCPQPIKMPIKINDTKTLDKIGRDPCYPLNGIYQQTADIVVTQDFQSIGNNTDPFTGEYDGQCRTISALSDCFVATLKGRISDLHLTGANIINSTKVTGLAACVVDINGTVSGVRAENAHISTDNYAGIGGGEVRGTVANTTAVNSTVKTSGLLAYAGIGGGWVTGTVANTTAVNSTVGTSGTDADAGIGGGLVNLGGRVVYTTAVNSRVKTEGDNAHAGIGGGMVDNGGTVANTTAVNSRVKTSGKNARAGIGEGMVHRGGTVANTTAVNSYVNGDIENFGSITNDQLLCQKADLRVLTANCSSRTEFLDALDFSNSNACPVNAAKVPTAATVPTAASVSTAVTVGITIGSLLAAGGLGIAGYSTYQWITGYREGLRGQELAMKPITCGRDWALRPTWYHRLFRESENE
ncbi:hypothetical protein [Endozoicomonas acroporae]|uniref:hypothetical protein n=1 Tax=Endozoicomonas acroporae TaxID=1701104 RepID=UPI0013D617BC|nr:hypothetical protein [Endozoicomonas acroporae]